MSTRARNTRFPAAAAALIVMMTGGGAAAQTSLLTPLPEEPPTDALYRLGPVMVSPRLTIPEIGHDSNAFNDAVEPKDDFIIKFTPEVDLFTDAGLLRVVVRSGSTFTYFHRYDSERSIAEQVRGRVAARLGRFRPWIGGASVRSDERTSEIDIRANRSDREISAGVEFDVTPLAALTVAATRQRVRFADATSLRELPLSEALDRTTEMASAGLRLAATPFTSVTLRGYASRDVFAFSPDRNARARGGEVEVSFSPEAVIRGHLALGYRQQNADDESIASYGGLTGRGGVTTMLLWHALLGVNYVRDLQYSFDRREGYYVETGADVAYTQRLGGPFDVQVTVAQRALDYNARVTEPARSEVLRSYQGGIGYSLDNGSRFGISYEFAERDGDRAVYRQFSRRRIFGSFMYEFWR
jgi:hypothetical protein